uniref:Uncharacterized protein n=1 Tax=Oryza meridionalis TaxID=40149 RepID=A0A0E0C0G1_9ORYZ
MQWWGAMAKWKEERRAWSFGEMESNVKQQQVGKGIKRKKGGGQEERQMHGWIIKEKKAAYAHTRCIGVRIDRWSGWRERDARYSRQANKSATENVDLSGGECGVEWNGGLVGAGGFIRSCGCARHPCLLGRQHLAGLG